MAVTHTWTPVPIEPAKRKPDGRPAAVPMLPLSDLEFIGCEAFPLTRGEYRRYEGRLEAWDAETETCSTDGAAGASAARRRPRFTDGEETT